MPLRFPPLCYGILRDRDGVVSQLSSPRPPDPVPSTLAHLHLRRTAGAVQVSGG